jgi:hypothetical protein
MAKVKRKSPSIDLGRVCYDSWIREAGYASDARVPPYDKLKEMHKQRWRKVTNDVIKAGNGHVQ